MIYQLALALVSLVSCGAVAWLLALPDPARAPLAVAPLLPEALLSLSPTHDWTGLA